LHGGKKSTGSLLALRYYPVYRGFERYEAHGVSLGFSVYYPYNYHVIVFNTGTDVSYVLEFGTEFLSFGYIITTPFYPVFMLRTYFSEQGVDVKSKDRFSIDYFLHPPYSLTLYLDTYLTKSRSRTSIKLVFLISPVSASVDIFSELKARALPNPTVLIV
jgi:hypothetical protein